MCEWGRGGLGHSQPHSGPPQSRSPSAGRRGVSQAPPGQLDWGAAGSGGVCRSPPPPGRRGGEGPGWGGRAERGAGGLGRPGTRRGQHDRDVPLLPALGTSRTGGSSAAAPRGPGAGVAERGWSRERAVDGTGCEGSGTERGRLHRDRLTGSGGNWRGCTGTGTGSGGTGTARRPLGTAGHRAGAGGTGPGAGPGGARGLWGAEREPARERSGGGQ